MWQLLTLSLFGVTAEFHRFYTEAFMYHLYKHILSNDPEDVTFSDNVIQAAVGNPYAPLKFLIIGDSMALSCGAKTHEAKLHRRIVDTYKDKVYVHAVGKFGATTADLPKLLSHVPPELHFDTTLLFVGANDVVHLHMMHLSRHLKHAVQLLEQKSDELCWAIGDPDMVPIISAYVHKVIVWVNKRAQKVLKKNLKGEHAKFLHIMSNNHEDPFKRHPEIYFAADGYHPSDVGYRYIFKKYDEEIIQPLLRSRKLL